MVRSVLLKPLDYSNSNLLVGISDGGTIRRNEESFKIFLGLAAYANQETMTLSGEGEPEVLEGIRMSAEFLQLEVAPIYGRGFQVEDDLPGAAPVAMISAEVWQRRFNSDPGIAGRKVNLAATSCTIVSVLPPRNVLVALLGAFALAGLLLALIGIYGVVAYSVARHNQEMGIRQALGAQRRDILRLILGQGVVLAMIGVGTGLGASIALTRVMTALLFHVSPTDPITFAAIAAFFLIVAIAACYMPALRATRIDRSLRYGSNEKIA